MKIDPELKHDYEEDKNKSSLPSFFQDDTDQ